MGSASTEAQLNNFFKQSVETEKAQTPGMYLKLDKLDKLSKTEKVVGLVEIA